MQATSVIKGKHVGLLKSSGRQMNVAYYFRFLLILFLEICEQHYKIYFTHDFLSFRSFVIRGCSCIAFWDGRQPPYSHLCDHEVESWETSLKTPWTHCTFICYTRRYCRPPIIYAVFFRGIGDDDEQNLLDLTFRISKQPLVEPVGLLIMDPRYFKESG